MYNNILMYLGTLNAHIKLSLSNIFTIEFGLKYNKNIYNAKYRTFLTQNLNKLQFSSIFVKNYLYSCRGPRTIIIHVYLYVCRFKNSTYLH